MWELDHKEGWLLKNWCFWTEVLGKTLETPLNCKEIQPLHSKGNQSWVFIGRTDAEAEIPNTLATWWEELTHWKRPWCWERLKVGGERDDRGWDGWMASPTQWLWVWVNSGNWWWTGKPGMYDWATELNIKLRRGVAQMVKNLPVMWETQVWSMGQKDPLEKGMATHSKILAWKITWIEELGRLKSMRSQIQTW